MSARDNDASLSQALDAWNAGDLDGYLRIYDRSLVNHGLSPEPLDYEGTMAFYAALWDAFPKSELAFEDRVIEGDKIGIRFAFRAAHEGEFMGVSPTGKQVTLTGSTILRFSNAKVVERWTVSDFLGLLVQLGVVPAPA